MNTLHIANVVCVIERKWLNNKIRDIYQRLNNYKIVKFLPKQYIR